MGPLLDRGKMPLPQNELLFENAWIRPEGKASRGWKAERTRQYVNISKRGTIPPSAGPFEP
jgi:hypothetical protein